MRTVYLEHIAALARGHDVSRGAAGLALGRERRGTVEDLAEVEESPVDRDTNGVCESRVNALPAASLR
ncbi:hypothetical protein ACFVGY_06730 [Streptomyces sp. NPDC127106]|uniref:hypothetical protein n=1 Tax=Streptomyces sp. NPDC127106 TaxID=3345360 RepID=UPI00362EAC9D